ncbi:MAG TPA: glycosyltransferase family 39 protein [Thermoanaerobaculia bacterium]|nr:glycosyltransferase family 39 protein [Thermoanaerobaculia bacterium]
MRLANVAFAVIFAAFAFLHLHRIASISPTWDEGTDIAITQCLTKTHDPFACLDDVSQTRLPYFIHAFVSSSIKAQYVISFIASALTLLMLYAFARREFGVAVATMTAALYVTSPQILASGRMLMTHSNILFTLFTTASFIAFYYFIRGRMPRPPTRTDKSVCATPADVSATATAATNTAERCGTDTLVCAFGAAESRNPLILSAVAFGLATSCSILGVFNGIAIAVFYAMTRRFAWRDLLFIPVAIATFFATSVIYLKPVLLVKLIRACTLTDVYPFWNYLNLGSPHAPWYFSLLLFVIKIGPWWLVLAAACYATTLHRPRRLQMTFLAAFGIALLINFALKGFVFRYDAPHHQVQFHPIVWLGIAALILEHRMTKPLIAAIAICFAVQIYDVIRFFPNYLFYGAQYGDRFIGEFYGPAVMHAQDRGPVNAYIDTLIARNLNVKILVADHNALERPEANFVPFTKRDPAVRYEYAFVDRLFATHLRFPERDAYNAYVRAHYAGDYTYYFPTHKWMYRVMKLSS